MGAILVAVCRMHDHAGRFVNNNDVLVLMDDTQRNLLGDGQLVGPPRGRQRDTDLFTLTEGVVIRPLYAIDVQTPVRVGLLDLIAGERGDLARAEYVESSAHVVGTDREYLNRSVARTWNLRRLRRFR